MRLLLALFTCASALYKITISDRPKDPVLSSGYNLAGLRGNAGTHSPCEFTFNPAWVPASPGFPLPGLLVRASGCPANYGGTEDHILFANAHANGTVQALLPSFFPFEKGAEDPRVVYHDGMYYNFYYAPGPGQSTVKVASTATPLDATSWKHLATLPWHRNGCVLLREKGPHYVIYGESKPLPGLGIATTSDFRTFHTVNDSLITIDPAQEEIVVEASTPPVQLSTGDYLHFYSAGTTGWVANGNYTGGWVILDKDDPAVVKQHSSEHLFIAQEAYELGVGPWPVQRKRTIFLTSCVPTGNKDEFRMWYGGADASVGTAVIQVTIE